MCIRDSGKVSGEVLLTSGAIQDEHSFGGRVLLTDVHVGTNVVDITNDGNVDVALKKGGFKVNKAVFRSGTSRLAISGSGSPRSGMAVQVDGSAELGLLSTFVPTLTSASGNLGLRVNVSGAFSDPVVFGSAKIKNGGFQIEGLPVPIEGLTGGVTFSERQVLVEKLSLIHI